MGGQSILIWNRTTTMFNFSASISKIVSIVCHPTADCVYYNAAVFSLPQDFVSDLNT